MPKRSDVEAALSIWFTTKAANTKRNYQQAAREFHHITGKFIEQARPADTWRYFAWLKEAPGLESRLPGGHDRQSGATIRNKITALAQMTDFLVSQDIMKVNAFRQLKPYLPPKSDPDKRPTKLFPIEYLPRILGHPEISLRDRAIIALLFAGGLRRNEVTMLKLGSIDVTEAGNWFVMLPMQKNKMVSRVKLEHWAVDLVKEYIEKHRRHANLTDSIFVSQRSKDGISADLVYQVWNNALETAGLPADYSPHSARAAAITALLDAGHDHRAVQQFARHKSITMTELYDKRRFEVDEAPSLDLHSSKTTSRKTD